ncbi:MAG: acyl-CoA dehydrogenase [Gammaproteobacteria bacterium]|nr:acyl-CoA dehydrogenase [Gammaproteobacteria bacterium]
MAFLDTLILVFVVLISAYFNLSKFIWTILLGAVLIVLTKFTHPTHLFIFVTWVLYFTAVSFALVRPLRIRFMTAPLIRLLQDRMPSISQTEKIAIESGDVWWEKELFCGRPKWQNLLAIPEPRLSPEEKHFINNQVETLCGMLNDWKIVNELHDLPPEVWQYLKNERFLGMAIPKEYGGLGFSALAHSSVVAKIATRCVSAAVSVMVPNSLGPGELLLHYGTTEQKNYYLPRLARGEEIPCFALTGPEAGSDAGSLTDSGVVCRGQYQGKEVLGIRLNWDKRYITLAPVATLLGLAIRLTDPDNLLGNGKSLGITLCLIPTNHAGVEIGARHLPLSLAFMNGPTRGKNVFIPLDWIIGGSDKIGHGWQMLMECLSVGRAISLPALSTACSQLANRATGAYARLRRQFNTPLAYFEGISEVLGEMAGSNYFIESCRLLTASAVDQKISPAIASAMAKYNMTELARTVVKHAMDIHAGQAIQVGPSNLIVSGHLAMPVSITVEGANILTRNLIIFGQGAIRCHPYILKEVEYLNAERSPSRFKKLDALFFSHAGYFISHTVRNLWCGLTGGRLLRSPVKGVTASYYRQLTRMSTALAWLSDVTMMMLGGELKRRERLSARLGDMLSQLYLSSAVLKYFNDQGQPESDVIYVKWCLETALARIQNACDALLDNFPNKRLGRFLHDCIFPFGKAYRGPSDKLNQKVALSMTEPSEFRKRMTHLVYTSPSADDPLHRLDQALTEVKNIEPLLKKLQKAIRQDQIQAGLPLVEQLKYAAQHNILSQDEIATLQSFNVLYQKIISVDEFSFNLDRILTKGISEWKEAVI